LHTGRIGEGLRFFGIFSLYSSANYDYILQQTTIILLGIDREIEIANENNKS